MSLMTRPTPWLCVPWGWWVKRQRRRRRRGKRSWMVSQAVGVDTIVSFASDLPAAQEENPTAQTAPIFPATQPASVVSAASPIVQAETATSPTVQAETSTSPTVQAETATSLTAPDVSPSTPESPPPPSTNYSLFWRKAYNKLKLKLKLKTL